VPLTLVEVAKPVEIREGDHEGTLGYDLFANRRLKLGPVVESGQGVVLDIELNLLELRLLVRVPRK
jgi:hypothetical protein